MINVFDSITNDEEMRKILEKGIREPGEDPEGPQVEDPDLSEVKTVEEIEKLFTPEKNRFEELIEKHEKTLQGIGIAAFKSTLKKEREKNIDPDVLWWRKHREK